MKVDFRRVEKLLFKDIEPGCLCEYEDKIYYKFNKEVLDEYSKIRYYNCSCVEDGSLFYIHSANLVFPIGGKFVEEWVANA